MFVQIIEGRTSDPEAVKTRGEVWRRELAPGAEGFLGSTAGTAADGRVFVLARFESEAAARRNSERPEQGEWWEVTAKLFDGEPTFTESGDVTLWGAGGSNDAGFVQVMKSDGVDRAQIERLDEAFEPFMSERPDLLGGIRIWTGPDRCVDVAYFTSEAEAREGEQREVPDAMKDAMAEMQEAMAGTEFLDLTDPQLT